MLSFLTLKKNIVKHFSLLQDIAWMDVVPKEKIVESGMVAHAFSPSTREAEYTCICISHELERRP